MGRIFNGIIRIAAVLGIAVAVKKLSEKENRDAVKNEYNKAKENPKEYAEDIQYKFSDKAHEYQDKAAAEYSRAKEDPKSYAQDVQSKVTEQAKEYQSKVSEQAKHYQEVAKDEYSKAKEDPKGYASNVSDSAKSKVDEVAKETRKGVDNFKQEVDDEQDTKPDAEDGGGHLTTEQEEENYQSEGNVHPDELEQTAEEEEVDMAEDPGEIDENHNIHVVYDEDNEKDK